MTQEQAMMFGINRFIFCGWNFTLAEYTFPSGRHEYVPDVILKAQWTCSTQHMVEKWLGAIESKCSDAYFIRFYAELDAANREAFMRSILENYDDEQKLSFTYDN